MLIEFLKHFTCCEGFVQVEMPLIFGFEFEFAFELLL